VRQLAAAPAGRSLLRRSADDDAAASCRTASKLAQPRSAILTTPCHAPSCSAAITATAP